MSVRHSRRVRPTYSRRVGTQRIEDSGDDARPGQVHVGGIIDATSSGKPPLLYYRSTFHDLGQPSVNALWPLSADDPHSGWFDATTTFTPFHLRRTDHPAFRNPVRTTARLYDSMHEEPHKDTVTSPPTPATAA